MSNLLEKRREKLEKVLKEIAKEFNGKVKENGFEFDGIFINFFRNFSKDRIQFRYITDNTITVYFPKYFKNGYVSSKNSIKENIDILLREYKKEINKNKKIKDVENKMKNKIENIKKIKINDLVINNVEIKPFEIIFEIDKPIKGYDAYSNVVIISFDLNEKSFRFNKFKTNISENELNDIMNFYNKIKKIMEQE